MHCRRCLFLVIAALAASSLSACGGQTPAASDASAMQTAIAEQVAATVAAAQSSLSLTATAQPSATQLATRTTTATKSPTKTPAPTKTRAPTATRKPLPTPTPSFTELAQTQTIGPIWDSLHDENFSTEVTLKGIQWSAGDDYEEPKPGNIYLVVHLQIKNLGPGSKRSIGSLDFQVLEANGALHDYEYVPSLVRDCDLETVDLLPGGSVEGCISFEVPSAGKLALIYAPFRYEGLQPGRYLSFDLRAEPEADAPETSPTAETTSADSGGSVAEADTAYAVIRQTGVNLRAGPGVGYPAVGQGQAGESYEITGRTEDGSWWQICCVNQQNAWVAASVVDVRGAPERIAVVEDIPTPPAVAATATPAPQAPAAPTEAPAPVPVDWPAELNAAKSCGHFEYKVTELRRVKAVYFYDDSYVAQGEFLLVFVEVKNISPGTSYFGQFGPRVVIASAPDLSTGDVLDDSSKGSSYAEWMYQRGGTYEDINPGGVLGLIAAYDIPSSQDFYLAFVVQDCGTESRIRLGMWSQVPQGHRQ